MFLEAFLLALASSTDNFMVGLSVGITNRSLSLGVNAFISICNATGAWLAGFGGSALGQSLPPYVSPLLSAITFGGLAFREFVDFFETVRKKRKLERKEKENENHPLSESNKYAETEIPGISNSSSSASNLDMSRAIQLAFPMTLNNLAGGVAGGAIGVSPLQAGLYGLLASFLTMALGHRIGLHLVGLSNKNSIPTRGKRASNSVFSRCNLLMDPSFASGSLLGVLCLMSLRELLVT